MKYLILIASIFSLSRAANGLVINAHDNSNEEIVIKNVNDEVDELVKDEESGLQADNLVATLSSLKKVYSVSFKIKPNSYSVGLKSVIHLTTNGDNEEYGSRIPGVWFSEDGLGRLVIASAVNDNPNFYFETEPLPTNDWTSIQIYQTSLNGRYTFYCNVNGMVFFSIPNKLPQSFEHVKVYVADPWYNAQDGSIKEIIIKNGEEENNELINNNELKLERNTLFTTLTSLEKMYSVSFKIKPTLYAVGWKSVIHLTTNGDIGEYGERTPGVWFLSDASGKLVIASAVNGNANYNFETEILPINEWSSIKISQINSNGRYTFSCYVNGNLANIIENNDPQSFKNVKVYLSDPWNDAQDGFVKEIEIKNGVEVEVDGFIKDEEFLLEKNNLIATLSSLEKVYSVSFQIKPNSVSEDMSLSGITNVIHLVTDLDDSVRGDRAPGVWFDLIDGRGIGGISFPIGEDSFNKYFRTDFQFPLNEWSTITFSQTELNGQYTFNFYFNGKLVKFFENENPKSFKHVKVYVTDPWNNAQDGSIKEIKISNGPVDKTVPNVKRLTYQRPRNLKKINVSNNKRSTHQCVNSFCCDTELKRSKGKDGKCA